MCSKSTIGSHDWTRMYISAKPYSWAKGKFTCRYHTIHNLHFKHMRKVFYILLYNLVGSWWLLEVFTILKNVVVGDTSYMTRAVISTRPHLHVLSSVCGINRLELTLVNWAMSQWPLVWNGKCLVVPTILELLQTIMSLKSKEEIRGMIHPTLSFIYLHELRVESPSINCQAYRKSSLPPYLWGELSALN